MNKKEGQLKLSRALFCLVCAVLMLFAAACIGGAESKRGAKSEGTASPAQSGKIGPVTDQVEIFVTSWCPYCRGLEEFLQANQVQYKRYDIETDPEGAMLHQRLGAGGVPLIRIGSTVIRGFNERAISSALKDRRQKS